ncbi:discoidin domain-containing protein, partial [Lysinibacillus capsici]|uniref:discoidin domain-containing protein n=1 Tax=Lysinibacillus capsici TaxID=2115968 RepID=UPI0034E259F9
MENKKRLKITSVFVVGLLLFNLISFGVFAGMEVSASSDTGGENVALGKAVTVSSEVEEEWGVSGNAVDGDETTSWYSWTTNDSPSSEPISETNPAWLMVDLGSPHIIKRWKVIAFSMTENYQFKDVYLEASKDGDVFTPIDSSLNNTTIDQNGYTVTINKSLSPTVTYQYFRIKVTNVEPLMAEAGKPNPTNIYEFELWGSPAGEIVDADTPAIGTQPTGATVNQGATNPTLSVGASVSDGGTLSYQWYSNTTNSTSGGTPISGATNATYAAPTSTAGTMYYYVVVTNTNSGVSGNPTAPVTSNVVGVTVNALVDAETPAIGVQPTGAIVNQGATNPTLSVG